MRRSIFLTSSIILSFLFSGCADDGLGITLDDKNELSNLLSIDAPKQRCTCPKIPIYKEPPVKHCTKSMTKDECLLYMSRVSMGVRYQFRKQKRACEAINNRNGHE